MATNGTGDQQQQHKVKSEELHCHVVHEKVTENGGTRYVIRVIKFEDNEYPLIGISRQWYKAPSNEWLPAARGHIYFPTSVWQALATHIPLAGEEIAYKLLANGPNDGRGPSSGGLSTGGAECTSANADIGSGYEFASRYKNTEAGAPFAGQAAGTKRKWPAVLKPQFGKRQAIDH